MIPKLLSSGQSFKGLAQYLTHDPKAQTAERFAWTHTLNLAHDDVASAVDEMMWTYRNAELLKEEAGVRRGGGKVEKPVKHFSLNFAPDERPSQEQALAVVESFMQRMEWQEHQAVLVAHEDKEHFHVHVMLNRIDPETGLALNDAFEYRRAQAWALQYEREQGKIYCEERLKPPEEREQAPTRDASLALKESEKEYLRGEAELRKFNPDYLERLENRKIINSEEWNILREHQRAEREAWFAAGKDEFSELRTSIYRDVREEFRPQWAELYSLCRKGADADALAEMRAGIIDQQKTLLDERRTEACATLREERDGEYRALLDGQQDVRAELVVRQEQGLSSPYLLDFVNRGERDVQDSGRSADALPFRAAANETCGRAERTSDWEAEEDFAFTSPAHANVRPGIDIAGNLGMGMVSGFAGIGEALFDGFFEVVRRPNRHSLKSPAHHPRNFRAAIRSRPSPRRHGKKPSGSRRRVTGRGGMSGGRDRETDPGSGPSAAAPRSPEKRRPKKKGGGRRHGFQVAPREADESAVLRARIASYFHLLRRQGEAGIFRDYAFRLAAASVLGRDEAAAVMRALCLERDAALLAFRTKIGGEENSTCTQEVASLRARQKERRMAQRRAVRIAGVQGFRASAQQVGERVSSALPRPLKPMRPRRFVKRRGLHL